MSTPFFNEKEHQALEADMGRLVEEIKKHRETPETSHLEGQELLKKSIQSLTNQTKETASPQTTNAPVDLPGYLQNASLDDRLEVEYLVDLAFHEGILKADQAARRASSFVLDAFHDALIKKLHPLLQEKGILK